MPLLLVYSHLHKTLLYSPTFSKLLFNFLAVLLWLRSSRRLLTKLKRKHLCRSVFFSKAAGLRPRKETSTQVFFLWIKRSFEGQRFCRISLDDCFSSLLIHSPESHLRVLQTSVKELSGIIVTLKALNYLWRKLHHRYLTGC